MRAAVARHRLLSYGDEFVKEIAAARLRAATAEQQYKASQQQYKASQQQYKASQQSSKEAYISEAQNLIKTEATVASANRIGGWFQRWQAVVLTRLTSVWRSRTRASAAQMRLLSREWDVDTEELMATSEVLSAIYRAHMEARQLAYGYTSLLLISRCRECLDKRETFAGLFDVVTVRWHHRCLATALVSWYARMRAARVRV